ncbi:hypothetical protein [Rhizobium leguminosarum]|uniref:hypothetical protein n=1 Tax=Rhizobium leguminosarum TaxID=384 RepID=UPI00039CFF28|nr:hypothetical protein [Rhizobium leguminosarum]
MKLTRQLIPEKRDLFIEIDCIVAEENVRTTDELFHERIAVALKALQSDHLRRLVVMIEALATQK